MVKNKAIIFDVDGVAVNSPAKQLPSERLALSMRHIQSKYYLSAATGRPWAAVKGILGVLGVQDPCIVASGTQIRNPQTGQTIWECNMDKEDVEAVRSILESVPDCRLVYNDYTAAEYYAGGLSTTESNFNGTFYYINCIFLREDAALDLIQKLSVIENLAITLAVSHQPDRKDILITNKLATKEHAVVELLRLLNVDRKEAIGIGDGHNDMDLFKAVNRKVAMGNAVPELKAASDEVIGDVAQDGFAEFLEKLHL